MHWLFRQQAASCPGDSRKLIDTSTLDITIIGSYCNIHDKNCQLLTTDFYSRPLPPDTSHQIYLNSICTEYSMARERHN